MYCRLVRIVVFPWSVSPLPLVTSPTQRALRRDLKLSFKWDDVHDVYVVLFSSARCYLVSETILPSLSYNSDHFCCIYAL